MEAESSVEQLTELLNGVNLNDMPVEVLHVMMSTLSFNDVKRLCSTVKGLKERCKRNDLIELKAREKVAREAPLGVLVPTYRKHAELIDRGFKSVYHVNLENRVVSFGASLDDPTFEIIGLPSAKGTRVWIVGKWRLDNSNESLPTEVYESRAEVDIEVRNVVASDYNFGVLRSYYEAQYDVYPNDTLLDDIDDLIYGNFRELLEVGRDEDYFAFEVELP